MPAVRAEAGVSRSFTPSRGGCLAGRLRAVLVGTPGPLCTSLSDSPVSPAGRPQSRGTSSMLIQAPECILQERVQGFLRASGVTQHHSGILCWSKPPPQSCRFRGGPQTPPPDEEVASPSRARGTEMLSSPFLENIACRGRCSCFVNSPPWPQGVFKMDV